MELHVGVDVGSTNARVAGRSQDPYALEELLASSSLCHRAAVPGGASRPYGLVASADLPAGDAPWRAALAFVEELLTRTRPHRVASLRVVGSGGAPLARALELPVSNACMALAEAMNHLHPSVRTVLEIGAERATFLRLEPDPTTGRLQIHDFARSGDCAAGTGSFLDSQAQRLGMPVESIGAAVAGAGGVARIAGRCSVFAESDMIHAQQRGHAPAEILRGLCDAIARNVREGVLKGHDVVPPVALIGGVARNEGVVRALRECLELGREDVFVPPDAACLGAIGACLLPRGSRRRRPARGPADRLATPHAAPTVDSVPLDPARVRFLRGRDGAATSSGGPQEGYLGIDVGSISTNLVVLDDQGAVQHESYLRTAGRPIDAVARGLREVRRRWNGNLRVRGVGTTGSGRELIGEVVGADIVSDEITAHKTGAVHVSTILGGPRVDTIFEIGGQDAKFIALENDTVVDFAMNEACAAGTGSFLEEQADKLGIRIEEEFARLAFQSSSPSPLGERCTVFMEREVVRRRQQGARTRDLAAGLAHSVALNYLNRVVRGRRVGHAVYFQGGTAYNDAVAAALAALTGKAITVPPHCGVMGAVGAALLARDDLDRRPRPVRFRGYDLDAVPRTSRSFVCKGCTNGCDIKQFTIEGRKSYWGDRCSDRYRKPAVTNRRPVIADLIAHREQALARLGGGPAPRPPSGGNGRRALVGLLRASSTLDRPAFWHAYLREIGVTPLLSPPTDVPIATRGAALALAAPCHPIQVAHGHLEALLEQGVDSVLVPNVRDEEVASESGLPSHLCPWNQVLPCVLQSCPGFESARSRILAPTVHFRLGPRHVRRALAPIARRLGATRRTSDRAVRVAFEAEKAFRSEALDAGAEALRVLRESGEPGILLLGRSYNLYDRAVNCDIPRKLRRRYGANVIPLDYLVPPGLSVDHLQPNMYWASGRRILAAAERARALPDLHAIYLTNFKCGPDSYLTSSVRRVLGAPLLFLQFDGHGGDAGYLTRCEAFLDSKGILRC